MPAKKKPVKLTQEELFPHGGFHYRLYTINVDGKKGFNKTAWFQCEDHLTKHIERYRITEGEIHVRVGEPALSRDPFAVKVKRTRKAKTTAPKASATKASKTTKAKKPTISASKTKSAPRTTKKAKKEAFSNLDTFFES